MEDLKMNLIRWNNPARLSNIFDDYFENGNLYNNNHKKSCGCVPAANIIEEKDAFEVDIAVPGMNKKDFKINLEKDLLTISIEKEKEEKEENKNFTRREFVYSAFSRSFTLPETIETEKINAEYENGILKIKLPKKAEAKLKLNKEIKIS